MAILSEQPRPDQLRLAKPYRTPDVQQLWYALQARPWLSLALVPSHPKGSVRDLAAALAEVGTALRGTTVHLFNAEGSDSSVVVKLMVEIRGHTRGGELVVVSLDAPVVNPTGISVIRAADAALLAIEMNEADLTSARRTIELVGPDWLLGSVLLVA